MLARGAALQQLRAASASRLRGSRTDSALLPTMSSPGRAQQRRPASPLAPSPSRSGAQRAAPVAAAAAAAAAASVAPAAAPMAVAPVATSSNSNQQQQQQSQQPQRQQPQQQYGRLPRRFARALTTAAAGPGARPPAGGAATKAPAPSSTTTAPAADGPWLIVGLGNPGPRYERTRHNVGFMVVDALARSEGIDMRKLEKGAAVGRGEVAGKRVLLAKPATFMNNSGDSVAALSKYYKVPPARCLVVSDDLDQPPAAVRLRAKGGHGGHNGLRSIIERLGGKSDFPRLKIGIGRPTGNLDVATYVLQDFRSSEMADVDGAVAESLRIIHSILTLGLEKALSGQRV